MLSARCARSRPRSGVDGGTRSFIEAPYRNNQMLAALAGDLRSANAAVPGNRSDVAQLKPFALDRSRRGGSARARPEPASDGAFVIQADVAPRRPAQMQAKRSGAPELRRSRHRNGGRNARPRFWRGVKSTMSSALITSRATVSTLPTASARPSSMLLCTGPDQPAEQLSEPPSGAVAAPLLQTTSMNWRWISASIFFRELLLLRDSAVKTDRGILCCRPR